MINVQTAMMNERGSNLSWEVGAGTLRCAHERTRLETREPPTADPGAGRRRSETERARDPDPGERGAATRRSTRRRDSRSSIHGPRAPHRVAVLPTPPTSTLYY